MLKGKHVFITGGDKGVGYGIVKACLKKGAHVYFTYNSDAEQAEKTKRELQIEGQELQYFQLDVTDKEAVLALAGQMKKITEKGIDILINNAGIVNDGFFLMANLDKWMKVLEVNLLGTIKHFLMQLVGKKNGSIINIASVGGVIGISGQTNYTAAKGGVIAFTKSLSKEVARFGVTVNAIAPGYVETNMVQSYSEEIRKQFLSRVPLNRFAQPEEVGALAAFLGSDESRYITGQVIVIDGGLI